MQPRLLLLPPILWALRAVSGTAAAGASQPCGALMSREPVKVQLLSVAVPGKRQLAGVASTLLNAGIVSAFSIGPLSDSS